MEATDRSCAEVCVTLAYILTVSSYTIVNISSPLVASPRLPYGVACYGTDSQTMLHFFFSFLFLPWGNISIPVISRCKL